MIRSISLKNGEVWLPEDCMAVVLSLTSPRDVCRCALASRVFRSAADSDTVWEAFLPPDYMEILTRTVEPVEHDTKKELYFRLCQPLLIDGGSKSFQLETSSGKRCIMLPAKEMGIAWGDNQSFWRWGPYRRSRFPVVAELRSVCWFDVYGSIDTAMLSLRTSYVAYLVYKLKRGADGFQHPHQEASISVGAHSTVRNVYLQEPDEDDDQVRLIGRKRADRWMEIAIGEFFNDDGYDGEVFMRVAQTTVMNWKRGLIVQGFELRPKSNSRDLLV